jgi:hypothetical protein
MNNIAEYEAIARASLVKGHPSAEMCTAHIFEGCLQSGRKGVHCKRVNPLKIFSSHQKNGESFQRHYSRVH